MKIIVRVLSMFTLVIVFSTGLNAQVIDPGKSAQAAAISDSRFIANSIRDSDDMMFLSRRGAERLTQQDAKEFAKQMVDDHSEMLYSMQHLQTAGGGPADEGNTGDRPAVTFNNQLGKVSGFNFDTTWISGMLTLSQVKYDQLTQAKETVTNPQLKAAITQAIPLIRKHVTKLKSLQKALIREEIQRKKEEAAKQKEAR